MEALERIVDMLMGAVIGMGIAVFALILVAGMAERAPTGSATVGIEGK